MLLPFRHGERHQVSLSVTGEHIRFPRYPLFSSVIGGNSVSRTISPPTRYQSVETSASSSYQSVENTHDCLLVFPYQSVENTWCVLLFLSFSLQGVRSPLPHISLFLYSVEWRTQVVNPTHISAWLMPPKSKQQLYYYYYLTPRVVRFSTWKLFWR